jgi:excisionase family DNA binding protein
LPAALAEWCDALDMYATEIGNVGNAGSPPRSPAVTVSVNEAARELQLSDRRVRQLLREGRLTGRRSHGTYKIDAASVIEEANRRGLE